MFSYTRDGSEELHQRIDRNMETVKNAVLNIIPEKYIVSILLGGGYGRGEGGVKIHDGKEDLFNDYDFFIFIKNISYLRIRQYQKQLKEVSHQLSSEMGIDVDFSPLLTLNDVKNAPFWLIWYELKYGHHVIWGREKILRYLPEFKHRDVPLFEGLKLLLNRGTGLLLCRERFEHDFSDEDREFITRNIYKAMMAMGDVYLMIKHDYHFSYTKRLDRFQKYKSDGIIAKYGFLQDYQEAIQYKLLPFEPNLDKQGIIDWYQKVLIKFKVIYYYAFSKYLHHHIPDVSTYRALLENSDLEVNDNIQIIKNIYYNLLYHKGTMLRWNWLRRYPRYKLFYTFPYLAFKISQPIPLEIYSILGLTLENSRIELLNRYLLIWQKHN
jgi:hypothetical protein